jgi:4a-hydroxytetrahydrobiopterin dehydratase
MKNNLLDQSSIETAMVSIPDWFLVSNKKITREFRFRDFEDAINFTNQLALSVKKHNHHPDVYIFYNKVEITLCTHEIGGLSQLDFALANEIDKFYQ